MTWPLITIILTTWAPTGEEGEKRIAAVRQSLESWIPHLKYEGELALHVADDGSRCGDYGTDVDSPPAVWWPGARSFSRQERKGVGASLNMGLQVAFGRSEDALALYVVDDWSLHCDLDLTEWASLLTHEDIGMVRFGPAHPNCFGRIEHFGSVTVPVDHDGFCLRLVPQVVGADRRANAYSFAHRPALYHRRFIKHWGWFDEDVDAIACEWLYNERWSSGGGTDIVLALPYEWIHLPSNRLSLINPSLERQAR